MGWNEARKIHELGTKFGMASRKLYAVAATQMGAARAAGVASSAQVRMCLQRAGEIVRLFAIPYIWGTEFGLPGVAGILLSQRCISKTYIYDLVYT